MNKCFWFKATSAACAVEAPTNLNPNIKPPPKQHPDVYVVEQSESAARIKARRKTDDETGLGQDYRLCKIYELGPDWNPL